MKRRNFIQQTGTAIAGGLTMGGGLLAVMLSNERGCEQTSFAIVGGDCKPGTQWTRTDEGLQSAGVGLLIGGAFLTVTGVTLAIVGGRRVRTTDVASAAVVRF